MSFRLEWRDAVRDDRGLSSSAKLVAFALETYMNRVGVCRPSVVTLAAATSLSERTVERRRDELISCGWLVVDDPGGGRAKSGDGKSNEYRAVKKGVTATGLGASGATKKGVTVTPEPVKREPVDDVGVELRELLAPLGYLSSTQLDDAHAAWQESREGVERCVRTALAGDRPAALFTSMIRDRAYLDASANGRSTRDPFACRICGATFSSTLDRREHEEECAH